MAATHLEQKLIDFEKCRARFRKGVRTKEAGGDAGDTGNSSSREQEPDAE